jgi:hypothetical protein
MHLIHTGLLDDGGGELIRVPGCVPALQPDILPFNIAKVLHRAVEGLVDWLWPVAGER